MRDELAKCDGDIATAADKCGCPNVFAVPDANNVITKILEDLRENTK